MPCVTGPDGHWGDQTWAPEEDRLRDCPAQHCRVATQLYPGEQVDGVGPLALAQGCGLGKGQASFLAWGEPGFDGGTLPGGLAGVAVCTGAATVSQTAGEQWLRLHGAGGRSHLGGAAGDRREQAG